MAASQLGIVLHVLPDRKHRVMDSPSSKQENKQILFLKESSVLCRRITKCNKTSGKIKMLSKVN